jgi:hypothetical protein
MDAQELRNLQEAYMEVYQEFDEAKVDTGKSVEQKQTDRNVRSGRDPGRESTKDRLFTHSMSRNFSTKKGGGFKYPDSQSGKYLHMKNKKEDEKRKEEQSKKNTPGTRYNERNRRFGEDNPGISTRDIATARRLQHQSSKGVKKEQVDIYDIILSHLLDEGYAETPEAAEVIMVNMSEEWREDICEVKGLGGYIPKGGTTYSGHYDDEHPGSRRNNNDPNYFYTKDTESGLSMSPKDRGELAAKRAGREGTAAGRRRANKIRTRLNAAP